VTPLRACHSERYDARAAVHDYAYHLRLAPTVGASVIHVAHFKAWRDSGLAFQFRDATYPAPNRSLASTAAGVAVSGRDRSGAELGRSVRSDAPMHVRSFGCSCALIWHPLWRRHAQVLRRGFWGDVSNSPFHAFGLAAEAPAAARLLRKRNLEHIFTAADVAAHNVTALLHELRTRERYVMPPCDVEPPEEAEAEAEAAADGDAAAAEAAAPPPAPFADEHAYRDGPLAAATLARCRVVLLTGADAHKSIAVLGRVSAGRTGALHALTLSTAHTQLLAEGLERLVAPNAVLTLEVRSDMERAQGEALTHCAPRQSAEFLLALKPAQARAFAEHATGLAAAAGWVPRSPRASESDDAPPLGHLLFERVARE
jgi:hypothetical protein